MVTKTTEDVVDISDISIALANDPVIGGIKDYADVSGGGGTGMYEPVDYVHVYDLNVIASGSGIGKTLTMSSGYSPIDGFNYVTGNRILFTSLANAEDNGIYVVTYSGSPAEFTRADDFDESGDVDQSKLIPVTKGLIFANSYWSCDTYPLSIDNSAAQFSRVDLATYTSDTTLHIGTAYVSGYGFPDNSTAIGSRVGRGADNAFVGYFAGSGCTSTGNQNVAIGSNSLRGTLSGVTDNVAIGYNSCNATTGTSNTAIGSLSMQLQTSGSNNTSVGYNTLYSNLIGANNTAIGYNALRDTLASGNTAVGADACIDTNGTQNSALGYRTLYLNATGGQNTALGYEAGYSAVGSSNVFLGHSAGREETGSNSLYVANSNTATPLLHGNFFDANLGINTGADYGAGQGVIGIKDAAAIPTTDPTGGVILYSEGGILKYRDPAGLVVPLVEAPPGGSAYYKDGVRCTSTDFLFYTASGTGPGATLTFSVGLLTIDGVWTRLGNRVLLKNQFDGRNGIWEVTTEGTASVAAILTRATDSDELGDWPPGFVVPVAQGTVNADTFWINLNDTEATPDVTWISFSEIGVGLIGTTTTSTLLGVSSITSGGVVIGYQAANAGAAGGNAGTIIGYQAQQHATSSSFTTTIGYQAGSGITSSLSNTFVGYRAGGSSLGARVSLNNVVVGSNSLTSIDGGQHNIVLGNLAMLDADSGGYNIALGNSAMRYGSGALQTNNLALGRNAYSKGEGNYNVMLGDSVAQNNVTGIRNVVLGSFAQYWGATGDSNTIVGYGAAQNSAGDKNTILGENAGYSGTTASNSVFIGFEAGYNEAANNTLHINSLTTHRDTPLVYGEFDNSNIVFNKPAAWTFRDGQGMVGIGNVLTAPTQHTTSGGYLYSEAGELKWMGAAGTITIIASA